MSDRTPEQRELARRERELRRATKEGRAPARAPRVEPDLPAAMEPPSAAGPVSRQGPEVAGAPPLSGPVDPVPVEPVRADPAPAEPDPAPAEPEPATVEPVPAPAEPVHASPPRPPAPVASGLAAAGTSAGHPDYEASAAHEPSAYDFETGEHEFEAPAGTRRVSHADSGRPSRHTPRLRRGRDGRGPNVAEKEGGRSWRGRVGALIALIVGAALIWFAVQLFQPLHGSGHGQITVIVPASATSSQIGDLLARDGVIDSSFFFQLRATLSGQRSDLRSGVYHLQLGMTYGAALTALTKAPPAAKVSTLTITEGRTRQYVAARLKAQHLGSSYLAATRRSPLINWRAYGLRHTPPTLEGVLFPDTYQLVDPVRISALVNDQIAAFKTNFARVDLSYARRRHLTPYEVVTIASMVEAEAASARDRPLVASVVYNRLAAGMMLQFDSTTRYATGNYSGPITVSELHSGSRWNTHTHLGLPPTPIDSPGLAALHAAAHPANTNDLFFFARRCGRGTDFTATYSQFLSDAAQDQRRHC